jgi:CHAD domain-containing protein
MHATRVVASGIRSHWQKTVDALEKFTQHAEGAGVHALRVGLRRLIAALELASALEAEPPRPVLRRLKRLLRALSPLRDLKVQAKTLEQLSPEEASSLAHVRRELERKRKRATRTLREVTREFPAERCEKALLACAEELERHPGTPSAARMLALAALARRYDKFEQRRRAVTAAEPDALHRARVAFKRYRYAVEIAAPLLPEPAQSIVPSMKRFQDELGAIQDATVLIDTLSRARRPRRARQADGNDSVLERLERERAEQLERALAALRAQIVASPPAFSEPFELALTTPGPEAPARVKASSSKRNKSPRAR